jgi:hypothetical protein
MNRASTTRTLGTGSRPMPGSPASDGTITKPAEGILTELVPPPARSLLRLTETKPDGRRLTRYELVTDQHHPGEQADVLEDEKQK